MQHRQKLSSSLTPSRRRLRRARTQLFVYAINNALFYVFRLTINVSGSIKDHFIAFKASSFSSSVFLFYLSPFCMSSLLLANSRVFHSLVESLHSDISHSTTHLSAISGLPSLHLVRRSPWVSTVPSPAIHFFAEVVTLTASRPVTRYRRLYSFPLQTTPASSCINEICHPADICPPKQTISGRLQLRTQTPDFNDEHCAWLLPMVDHGPEIGQPGLPEMLNCELFYSY